LLFLLFSVLLVPSVLADEDSCHWPSWQQFKEQYIVAGRVIDYSDERLITTSEGQSYGMFFALLGNDQKSFAKLLAWTQRELAGGDLGKYLPAWLWGKGRNGKNQVLDANSASDADLWIAYTLIEAGRLWHNYYYTSLGYLLLGQIREDDVVAVPDFGLTLLPAPLGFNDGEGKYRLNPSYAPPQLMALLASVAPHSGWPEIELNSRRLLLASMPKGFVPDWLEMTSNGFATDVKTKGVGSYDAIRNYLWVGMLADGDPDKTALVAAMQPMIAATRALGHVPEQADTISGSYRGLGPAGFSAALLPLLSAADVTDLLIVQRQRAHTALPAAGKDKAYYNAVLAMFGLGWDTGRYRFDIGGKLQLPWQNLECGV
jgi:endoglucanase